MIPTFSIECSASSRLRSCWNSAYVTPPTRRERPETRARARRARAAAPRPIRPGRGSSAYIATLIITPLISADTGAGAIGCARGSQTCSGMTPAFVPMPTSAASAIAICSPEPERDAGRPADRSGVREQQYRDPRARAAEVRDRHVREHRVTRLLVGAPPDENHRGRHQRHHLPRRAGTSVGRARIRPTPSRE